MFCVDEFGPLDLQPRPGRRWAAVSGKGKNRARRRGRGCARTYTRIAGVRHLFAALELGEDKLYGHIKPRKTRGRFLELCRYLRSLYPATTMIAIICDNFSPHLSTRKDRRVGTWATANNGEIAYTPTNSSWLNRIEAQFGPVRTFVMGNSDYRNHPALARRLQDYLRWRNAHARHPDVLAAQRRERARIRSERQQRWGRPKSKAA